MTIKNVFAVLAAVAVLAFAPAADAQINSITATTTTAAAAITDGVIAVTATTGMSAVLGASGNELYVISPGNQRGETMTITAINSLRVSVTRGRGGARTVIPSGATVLIGAANWFQNYNPSGGCTAATTYVTPFVNTKTGEQWLCSTVTLSWVPGWNTITAPAAATATVASAAGVILPSGPLFSVSGTSAITGFTVPVGFTTGSFTVIPTGIFTWTTAGNIGVAGTAVVGRAITFTWSATASKFYPSYV
jgi:hypothetical protein